MYPNIKVDEVYKIVVTNNLSVDLFNKKSKMFMTSVQFSNTFKTMSNWNKKQWGKIYVKINKWVAVTSKPDALIASSQIVQSETNIIVEDEDVDDQEEKKIIDDNTAQYMDAGTDMDLVKSFCELTNCDKDIATVYLKATNWDLNEAIGEFYAFNGNVNAFYQSKSTIKTSDKNTVWKEFTQQNWNELHNECNSLLQQNNLSAPIYNHGVEFWYWKNNAKNKRFITPKCATLKDEILKFNKFTVKDWKYLSQECVVLMETDRVKTLSSNGNKAKIYEITRGDAITIEHLLSIKLYTDYSWLCKIFCEAFRFKTITRNCIERIESVQNRNEKIATWGRLLIEAVQAYGKLRTNNSKYYRGISSGFMFRRFILRFYAPLSTSIDFNKAVEFAQRDGNGLVMELAVYNEYVSGLYTSPISAFPEEQEVIFFGGGSILKLGSIFQWDSKWSSYRVYIKAIQNMLRIVNGSIEWNRTNDMKDIIAHVLPHLYFDYQPLPSYISSLLNYHLTKIKKVEYDFRELSHSYIWVQHIFVKHKNIPHVSNACNLLEHCTHVKFIMSNDHIVNDKFSKSVVEDVLNIKNKNVIIEFAWISEQPLEEFACRMQWFAEQSQQVCLHLQIHKAMNSFTIEPVVSKASAQNVKSIVNPNSTPLMDDDSILILIGYVRIMEQKYTFFYAIPNSVIGLCARFYGGHFFQLEDADKASPFSLLFATLNMSSALSINGWDSLDSFGQCSCLERDKIDTDIKRRAVVDDLFENTYQSVDDLAFCEKSKLFAMVTNFYVISQQAEYKRKQYLFGWEFMRQWTIEEIIISMMDQFINTDLVGQGSLTVSKWRNSYTTWKFVEMYRRFCNDTGWNGTSMYNFLYEVTANGRGFCLKMVQKICNQYSLKFGRFAKCKREVGKWSLTYMVDPSIMSQIKGENK